MKWQCVRCICEARFRRRRTDPDLCLATARIHWALKVICRWHGLYNLMCHIYLVLCRTYRLSDNTLSLKVTLLSTFLPQLLPFHRSLSPSLSLSLDPSNQLFRRSSRLSDCCGLKSDTGKILTHHRLNARIYSDTRTSASLIRFPHHTPFPHQGTASSAV